MFRRLFFGLLLLALASPASAQTTHQRGYWLRYYNKVKLSPRWTLHSELDERRFIHPDKQWQLITHQHLHYRVRPNLDAALGGTYSRQPQGPATVPEWRLFEEASLTVPLHPRLRLQPRLRVEQRWIGQVTDGRLTDSYQLRSRVRGRLQLEWQPHPRWRLRASDELMLHTDSFDQNRVYASAEYQLGANFGLEAGYLNIWQRRLNRPDYYNRDVLRLTLTKEWAIRAGSR